ncbi:MAG: proton extrusion protein PcxA [Leptolyngbyaceae cyanobacterium bins.349]|nr:proton extrusion protein PcxA [Leptolyngbyaceae cyanobacterium bins.349]
MTSFLTSIGRSIRNANRWLIQTPDRALDQAYDAALMIKAIEDQHFDGGKISQRSRNHSETVLAYFQSELKKYLKFAELRLIEFKASRVIVDSTNSTLYNRSPNSLTERDRAATTLEKLQFIDSVLTRYQVESPKSQALVPINPPNQTSLAVRSNINPPQNGYAEIEVPTEKFNGDDNSILDKTGVLPRSILGTLNRIKRDLDPNAEAEVVRNFRSSKAKTLISIRLLLLLVIVPLLVQQLSKSFIVGPIVDRIWQPQQTGIFLNYELEEEALREFQAYRERLEFEQLLGVIPAEARSPELTEARLQEKAQEIAQSYAGMGANAIKNIFSDILSAIAFAVVLVTNRQGLEILKSFIDETVYGLSDSAKAFIIILFTDIFVGFHSPHGWEVLLEGLARHFGLPASRDFIFLFIATFPVILDTIFKYWIFRYLNRISPSAVATYKNMNET